MLPLGRAELDAKSHNGAGTLGGHCFRYAGLLAGEYHFGSLNLSAPRDNWATVNKKPAGGVGQEAFVAYFLGAIGRYLSPAERRRFGQYLEYQAFPGALRANVEAGQAALDHRGFAAGEALAAAFRFV